MSVVRGLRLLLTIWMLCGSQALGTERIEYRVPEGLAYQFEFSDELRSTLEVSGAGQAATFEQHLVQTLSGAAEVLRVEAGRPVELRVRFDAASGTVLSMNGMPQPQPFALAGQTVTVQLAGDAVIRVSTPAGQVISLDDAALDQVATAVVLREALLPERPVGVGDRWEADFTDPDGSVRPKLAMTLRSFADQDGRSVALVFGEGRLAGRQAAMTMQGPLSGTIALDLTTGMPLRTELSGVVEIAGRVSEAGVEVEMQGGGPLTRRSRLRLNEPVRSGAIGQRSSSDRAPSTPRPKQNQATPGGNAGDRRLVGQFGGEAVAGGGDTGAYVNTQLSWIFRADGRVFFGSQAHYAASERDYNGDLEWAAGGQTAADTDSGNWTAKEGILSIEWDDGRTMRVAYGFEPDGSLVFRNAQTRKLINFYKRLR